MCVHEDFTLKRMTKAITETASRHAFEDLDLESHCRTASRHAFEDLDLESHCRISPICSNQLR